MRPKITKEVLGIDIGGTNIKIAVVDHNGLLQGLEKWSTDDFSSSQELINTIAKHKDKWPKFQAIGVGAPNANTHTGEIKDAPNLSWPNSNIVSEFSTQFNLPTFITNDANAFAIAEKYFGQAQGHQHFAVITLGTGLGSGLYCEGELLHGSNGAAGELGHIIIEPDGRKCACGGQGHAEAYLGAGGILQSAKSFNVPVENLQQLATLANEGDNGALKTFQATGEYLGRTLATLYTLFCPEMIFIQGGISRSSSLFLETATTWANEKTFSPFKGQVKIKHSEIPDDQAGVLGAAALAFHHLG